MIELHLSAGHAWDVWETKGGLEPTVDSLAIPKEIAAKFKAWGDK